MARKPDGNGKVEKADGATTALQQAQANLVQAQLVQNQSAAQQSLQQLQQYVQQSTASLQQMMATVLQNHALFEQRFIEMRDWMDRKFAEVDSRLENIEAFLVKMSAELPERVFGFAQAQQKPG